MGPMPGGMARGVLAQRGVPENTWSKIVVAKAEGQIFGWAEN